jgi:hypothetical protein
MTFGTPTQRSVSPPRLTPYAVMRRMWHSSINVTYDTYGHLFAERDAEITANLESLRRAVCDERVRTVCGLGPEPPCWLTRLDSP